MTATGTEQVGVPSSQHEFTVLAERLAQANALYYGSTGDTAMDDATYDASVRALAAAAEAHPEWAEGADVLTKVAAGTSGGDIPHSVPMLSLDNAMDDTELTAFFERVAKLTGAEAAQIDFAVDPKLDGLALSVRYVEGRLERIVTRGNGLSGEDVTANARVAVGIPEALTEPVTIEVRGECVMTHDDFEKANRLRVAAGDRPFSNPRNAAAGSLRTKHRTYQVPLSFFAYGLVDPGRTYDSYSVSMDRVTDLGFTPARAVLDIPAVLHGADAVRQAITQIEAARAGLPMDTDGAVVKVNGITLQRKAGDGSRAPRWAIARKFPPDTRETDLLGIEVDLGRTGNLSFRAVLAPVSVGGATVTYATLHNASQIAAKALRLPIYGSAVHQRVIVRRAGEVIPEVVGPANDTTDGTEPFAPPERCPRCGSELDRSGQNWRCVRGRKCYVEAGIRYAVGRDCLDIDGMGDKVVAALVTSGRVEDVADLFTLELDDLVSIERMGEKNASKILASIERARALPLSRVFCALGIKLTGRRMSRRLARHFSTMAALRAASAEALAEVEGVGPVRARTILAEMAEIGDVLDRLEDMGIGIAEPHDAVEDAPLAGKKVVVSGVVSGLSRNEANEWVERLGGKSSGSVSKSTDLLVAGEGAGSKLAKAQSLGVEVMAAEAFAALVAASGRRSE